jgi:hypothetical protein
MTVVPINVNGETKSMYIDSGIYHQLVTYVIPAVQKVDFDYPFCIDGEEGVGKSVLSFQLAKILDPNFTVDNIAFNPDQFETLIRTAKQFSCIVYDEAFTGLSSRGSMSEINHILVAMMMEMRQLNLFVIIVLPTFFMLDKYVALHRAKCLFHVGLFKEGSRGLYHFYPRTMMRIMYNEGKKTHWYRKTKVNGRFLNVWPIDEAEYRKRKKEALVSSTRNQTNARYKLQRNVMIRILSDELHYNTVQLEELFNKYHIPLKQPTISEILRDGVASRRIDC